MKVFYANCKYENWEACKSHEIFGLRGKRLPDLEAGDLILLRVTGHTGEPYGVKAIWRHESVEPVEGNTFVPWKDGEYHWVLHCTSLAEFKQPFSEEFATSSKVSQKIEAFFATRIMGSIGVLKPIEAISYIQLILQEKSKELRKTLSNDTPDQSVLSFLEQVSASLQSEIGYRIEAKPGKTVSEAPEAVESRPPYGIVGERIELPILNYAPLNEMGVILLFGYYLQDLGFSHLEEIRAAFPDAIGMQRIDDKKYRRVRIEFEFTSRNFLTHGHSVQECDIVVCWEHNWSECPLEVIELRSALFSEE